MTDQIELSVRVDGKDYAVRCELPCTLRASSGPMSVYSAIHDSVEGLAVRLSHVLDSRLEHPRRGVVTVDADEQSE